MNPETIAYINSLNIRVYVTNNNQTIIGKLIEAHENSVEIRSAFTIEPVLTDSGITRQLLPLIPGGYKNDTILYRNHIIAESECPDALKQSYAETLIAIELLIEKQKEQLSDSTDLESSKNLKGNPFSDRYKF